MDKCNHRYRLSAHSCAVLIFRCRKCGENASRATTKEEKKEIIKEFNASLRSTKDSIHWISHQYRKKFMERDRCTYKYFGYNLMQRVEKWVKNYPSIQVVPVDCGYFMGAILVLIPHENKYEYFGTTAIFIEQDDSKPPAEFFLYPSSTKWLMEALRKIQTWEKKKRPKPPKSFVETLRLKGVRK